MYRTLKRGGFAFIHFNLLIADQNCNIDYHKTKTDVHKLVKKFKIMEEKTFIREDVLPMPHIHHILQLILKKSGGKIMKNKIICMLIGLVSCIVTSCGFSKGGKEYPQNLSSNEDQITGIIVSKPIEYDNRLGYKLAIDENQDGVFDNKNNKEHYAWMPNDMYYEIKKKDSVIIKAVRFQEDHFFGNCDEYIIFNWHLAIQDTLTLKRIRRGK